MRNTNLTSVSNFKVKSFIAGEYNFDDEIDRDYRYEDILKIVSQYANLGDDAQLRYHRRLGLLAELYHRAAGDQTIQQVVEILSKPQCEYTEGSISPENMDFLLDYLDEVFEYIVNSEKGGWSRIGLTMQSTEVTSFLVDWAGFPEGVTVYNPFAGLCSYSLSLKNNPVIGEELNPTTWALAQIRLFIHGIKADIRLGNSFENMTSPEKFDAIVTTPTYDLRAGYGIQDIVSHLYDKLTDNGKLVCIVPIHFLYSDRRAKKIRTRLIQDEAIQAVILLPGSVFSDTRFTHAAIYISKGNKANGILMADATKYTRMANETARDSVFDGELFAKDLVDSVDKFISNGLCADDSTIGASIEELYGDDILPLHYLVPTVEKGISCDSLMEEVKPIREKRLTADYIISPSLIPESMHRKPLELSKLERGNKSSLDRCMVKLSSDCILVAQQGRNINAVYVEGDDKIVAYAPGYIRIFKPKNGYSAKYVAALLSTDSITAQIRGWLSDTIGMGMNLNCVDFSRIIAPNHKTEEERERVISRVISSEMSELEAELQEVIASQKREMRSTRHAMVQTMSALSSKWEVLKMFAEKNGGKIDLNDMVGRVNPISVKDLMTSLDYTIDSIRVQIDSLRLESVDWGKNEAIYPYEFINEYIAKHSNPMVRMTNRGSEGKIAFYASPHLVRRIFDNIVANAMSHGFTNSQKPNHEIRFDWSTEGGNVVITIANNGVPLKEGVSEKDVLMSGFSTALNLDAGAGNGTLHSGHGGHEIKMLMEDLGSVKVISKPDEEFTVIYQLTFNKTNWETVTL